MAASLLVWLQSSPFNHSTAREALDYALAMAAVDHQVQIVFSGPAVLLLSPHQQLAAALQLKDFTKSVGIFELYDIPPPLVSADCLQRFQLDHTELAFAVDVIPAEQLSALFSRFQHVVSF